MNELADNRHMTNRTHTTTKTEAGYEIHQDGVLLGRVRKAEHRTPVYAGGSRHAVGYRVAKTWDAKIVGQRTTSHRTLDAAVKAVLAG